MTKWTKETKGYGRYTREIPKKVTDKKAERLRSEGKKVYDSYSEAKEDC